MRSLILFLMLCFPMWSATWVEVGKSSDNSITAFIDVESATFTKNDKIRAWVKLSSGELTYEAFREYWEEDPDILYVDLAVACFKKNELVYRGKGDDVVAKVLPNTINSLLLESILKVLIMNRQ